MFYFSQIGLDSCLKKLGQENHVIIVTSSFEKLRFQNVFRPHEDEKPAFSNFSGLKSIFENSENITDRISTERLFHIS